MTCFIDWIFLLLWAIADSDFSPLEIYKNLALPLSTITFTVNSHADNRFCKYIYLFQILVSQNEIGLYSEAVVWRCSVEKVFLEISQNSQENTCVRDCCLIKLQALGLQLC